MSEKLDRLYTERDNARRKRDLWGERLKDLEKRCLEQENTEIHEAVRAANLNPAQLSRLIAYARKGMTGAFPPEVLEKDADLAPVQDGGTKKKKTGQAAADRKDRQAVKNRPEKENDDEKKE